MKWREFVRISGSSANRAKPPKGSDGATGREATSGQMRGRPSSRLLSIACLPVRPAGKVGERVGLGGAWRNAGGITARQAAVLLASLSLVACIFVASALADESVPVSEPSLSEAQYRAALSDSSDRIVAPEPDEEAAEELPHQNLERAGAEELLTGVFGEVIEGEVAVPGEEADVTKYYSDHVAVVENPLTGSPPALLESLLPLRTTDEQGQQEPIDLELSRDEGELQPENPLVEVGVPAKLAEGISLPGAGVEIRLKNATQDPTASMASSSTAFYPNVEPDTDMAVSPTATGLETLTQIRSPEAPDTETFELAMPAGAELRSDGEGGAEVVQGDQTLVSIEPPTALDAAGDPVPVVLELTSDTLSLRVEPAPTVSYPILVDPVYETYFWELNHSTEGTSDWVPASNSPLFESIPTGRYGEAGLNIYTNAGYAAPGTQANWNYHVPRFYTDQQNPSVREMPTSYIQSATFSDLRWWIEESGGPPFPADPSLVMGLWDESASNWAALGVRTGQEGQLFDQSYRYVEQNPNENTHVKTAAVLLQDFEGVSRPRHLLIGQAEVQVTDADYPHFASIGQPSRWVNNSPTSPIPYSVTDTGLGVNELRLWEGQSGGGQKEVNSWAGCFGNVSHPCPRTVTQAQIPLNYDPSTMPQGEDWVTVGAVDPVGHWSGQAPEGHWSETRIKVDHTPPEVTLGGSLTQQTTLGTHRPTYNLTVNAVDGTATAPQSGVASTEVKVDGVKVPMAEEARWNPNCATRNCSVSAEWELNAAGYAPGRHEVRVIATDAVGLATTKSFWIELHPKPPTLSLAGTLTEQATLGTTRPQYKLLVTDSALAESPGPAMPTYLGSFGSAGTTPGHFTTVDGVAVDAKGDIWTVDQSTDLLQKFGPKGELIGSYGGQGSGNGQLSYPIAVAVNGGHVWVADEGNARIDEFSETGKYLSKFGVAGHAAGQIDWPCDLVVDPNQHIWVAELENDRVQEFSETGTLLKTIGSIGRGVGNGTYSGASGVAIGPGNRIWVSDYGQNKIEEFSESGGLLRQFGGTAGELGGLLEPMGIYVDAAEDVYVVDRGHDRIVEFNGAGEFVGQVGAKGATAGGLEFPNFLAATQTGNLLLADTGNSRIDEWQKPNRRSQISTEILVDGKRAVTKESSCQAEGCAAQTEWLLESSTLTPGSHSAVVRATDGLGNTTSKTLSFTIAPDQKGPALEVGGPLTTAPKGWVEQKNYEVKISATDEGTGVTDLKLLVDGKTLASKPQACPEGGCSELFQTSVNMEQFGGGSHAAEVVAVDGAGNMTSKKWTINVDPEGHISIEEAEETLKAVDATGEVNLVGQAKEEPMIGGTANGLAVVEEKGELKATGTNVPLLISSEPAAGLELQVLGENLLYPSCENDQTGQQSEGAEPTEKGSKECQAKSGTGSASSLQPVEIVPVASAAPAEHVALLTEETGTIAPNAMANVDSVVRPLFDGALQFQAIRNASAPETYSWEVALEPEQELKQITSQIVDVLWNGGQHVAFSIEAEPASDATGAKVPTHISISSTNVVTLTVELHSANYVYPVVAGTGWQGGFETYHVEMPPPEEPSKKVEGASQESGSGEEFFISAPEHSTPQNAGVTDPKLISQSLSSTSKYFFRWIRCGAKAVYDTGPEGGAYYGPERFECGNPFIRKEGTEDAEFSFGVRGWFFASPGNFVSHRGSATEEIECAKQDFPSHYSGGLVESQWFIDPAEKCLWWGRTAHGGGSQVSLGEHLSAYGEWNSGIGSPGSWHTEQLGSAIYIWATAGGSGYKIERHKTTCIDC